MKTSRILLLVSMSFFACNAKKDKSDNESVGTGKETKTTEKPKENKIDLTPSTNLPIQKLSIVWNKSETLELYPNQISTNMQLAQLKDESLLISSGLGSGWYKEKDANFWEQSPEQTLIEGTNFSYLLTDLSQWSIKDKKLNFSFSVDGIERKTITSDLASAIGDETLKTLHLSNEKISFALNNKILIFTTNKTKINMEEIPWPPEKLAADIDKKLVAEISQPSADVRLFMSKTHLFQIKKYTIESKPVWLWSAPVQLEFKDATGDLVSSFIKVDAAYKVDKNSILLTKDGLFSFESDQAVAATVQLSWATDILPLADKYCYVCHKPGSGKNWTEGKTEASWIQKANAIKSTIASGSMPPSSHETGRTITAQEKAKLTQWLNQSAGN